MPWIDNQYIFPRAAAANMQEIWPWPSPEELPPPPPINPLLRARPLLQPYDGADYTDSLDSGLLSDRGTTYSGETTTPTVFEDVGETARNIGKVAGVAGLLGAGPIALGVEGLAGLSEMRSLNEALSNYAQRAGIQNMSGFAGLLGGWDAIAAGFNPFEDLRDVAQGYFFDPHGLGDIWTGEEGFDITEAEPEEGFPPGPGFNEMDLYAAPGPDDSSAGGSAAAAAAASEEGMGFGVF
jgi:hypothetical protein